ncbi:hypothetical protein JJB09_25055 [Rhizobium sp. KVB221]|uniref:Haemolysin-type calcium binding-related domain-containing protein n=1 Tax=Rhizobium setariae TaxID=2801340 RepID=A0A936YT10_9HYPH|nr:calcium-binding protein [Rhizobium setariae]MBL0375288.1 hypothetical protein [Rhizobium setariae]
MASIVEIHHVIPEEIYNAFIEEIELWTNGQFKLDAIYNLVPIAAQRNIATAIASGSPLHGTHPLLNQALLDIFGELKANPLLTNSQKGAEFAAIQSCFRQGLDYSSIDGFEFKGFPPTFLDLSDPAAEKYLTEHEYEYSEAGLLKYYQDKFTYQNIKQYSAFQSALDGEADDGSFADPNADATVIDRIPVYPGADPTNTRLDADAARRHFGVQENVPGHSETFVWNRADHGFDENAVPQDVRTYAKAVSGQIETISDAKELIAHTIAHENGSISLEEARTLADDFMERMQAASSHPEFEASLKHGLVSGIGSSIGDLAEALDALYDPLKNAIATGNWSEFAKMSVDFGFSSLATSLAIGGVTVAVGATLGSVAAGMVSIGVVTWGVIDGVQALMSLGNKIQRDLAEFVAANERPVDEALIHAAITELFNRNGNPNFDLRDIVDAVQTFATADGLDHTVDDRKSEFDTLHAIMAVATSSNDTLHGSSQNDIVYGGGGDDVIEGRLGRDILIGGSGSDTFIDSVTEQGSDGRQNESDVYLGGSEYEGVAGNFLNWLMNKAETDTVRYAVDAMRQDDPETPGNEAALQNEGITVETLDTAMLGATEVVKITVQDQATGASGTDFLFGIEKVELSDRADTFQVSQAALDTAIIVDMGKSGRVQSELPEGETLSDNAFTTSVDVVDYSEIDHGLIYIKGTTHEHSEVTLDDDVFTSEGLSEELEAITDYATGGLLGYNDKLHVEGADKIILTDHDDVLISSDYGSIVYTGEGEDKVWFQDGVAIADLSADDRISLLGSLTLYGGLKNGWSESPWAWGPYGTAYGLNDSGELVISNVFWQVTHKDENGNSVPEAATMYVLNFQDTLVDREGGGQLGAGNIFLLEYKLETVLFRDMTQDQVGKASAVGAGAFDLIGWMIKTMTGKAWFGGEDPLVLDLDGDGIELTALDRANNHFDIDGDLYAEATGFVGRDDGVLARDINGNGRIDSSDEMFGQGATSGFEMLKALDGNHDGVVDLNDNGLADFNGDGVVNASDTFDKLLIWQDADQDLRTDAGELKSASEWGITSFEVPSEIIAPGDAENPAVVNGNIINQTASYTKSDGSTHTVADVTFKVENQTTNYVGPAIAVSASVRDLADLKGYGTLVSLHEAMSVRPESEAEVRAAVAALNTPDLSALRVLVQPVLEAWALGSPIKIDGVVHTGVMASGDYDDMIFIKNGSQVSDYTTSIREGSSSGHLELVFASGAKLTVSIGGASSTMTGGEMQAALRDLLNNFFSADGNASFSVSGPDLSHNPPDKSVTFQGAGGTVVLNDYSITSWAGSISGGSHSLAEGASFAGLSANEFSFYERVMGESLEPFFEEPDNASAGNDALEALISKMDTVLNTFAVRIAVQSGPLAHYFDSVDYDVASNGFVSQAGRYISDVFHALLVDAEAVATPVAWLSEWKPFMDVFFADYSRGGGNLPVNYGYLVQQMMNAVERENGGISVANFADAFGIPEGLVQNGSGTVDGRSIEDIILIDGDEVLVRGGSGSDNYIIGRHFGTTEIYDKDGALDSSFDTLRFSAHNASDIIASREGADLLLTDAVTGETIRITNEFEGRWPGATISDASFDYGVGQIAFADGTLWSKTDIALAVSKIDDNSTTLVGSEDIDVLQGGHGDDRLEGGGDTDIYRYSFGDGADTIFDLENNAFRNDNDMLQFLDGIRIADLVFERDGASNDLLIKFKNHAGDQIRLEGLFGATYTGVYGNWYQNRIELYTFDDGSSLSFDQLASLVLKTYSTTGNDLLYGMDRQDVLVAGKGDDYVSGGNQSDTYIFNLGDGNDKYEDNLTNILSGTDDTLVFGAGIGSSDIIFDRVEGDRDSIVLRIAGSNDSVTLLGQYASTYAFVFGAIFFDRIETVRFSDEPGTVWSYENLAEMALTSWRTSGNDTIHGFDLADVIDGGAGDDFLSGGDGNDTYIWGAGYGNDTIEENGDDPMLGGDYDAVVFQGSVTSDDVIVGRKGASNDLTITLKNTGETLTLLGQVWYTSINYQPDMVDRFKFSDGEIWTSADLRRRHLVDAKTEGDDVIYGFYSSDTLDGGAGNDKLDGGDGSDTYLFGYGSGNDIIGESWNNVLYPDDDKVVFGTGITQSDVAFSRIGNSNDLLITLTQTGETLTIWGEFYTGHFDMNDIEEFMFSDGTSITEDDLRAYVLSSTSADETIYGFDASDVFRYGRGDGHDIIVDGMQGGNEDQLLFADINPSDVTLVRDGDDVTLVIAESSPGAGDSGSVRLNGTLRNYYGTGVDKVVFADGTIWTPLQMRDWLLTGTQADETLVGTGRNDIFSYARGGGNDVINDGMQGGNEDQLLFADINPSDVTLVRDGDDVTLMIAESSLGAGDGGSVRLNGTLRNYYGTGIDKVVFADGTIWTPHQIRDWLLTSTQADETLQGFGVNDTFRYGRGDGHDIIIDGMQGGNEDQLLFADINPSEVTLVRDGDDVTLMIAESSPGAGDGGSVRLNGTLRNYYGTGVDKVVFADGTIWTEVDLRNRLLTSTSANENFLGFVSNDTYRYSRGGGHDTINETGAYWGNSDKLLLLDINPNEVSLTRNGNDVTLGFAESSPGAGDAGSILIKGALANSNEVGIEQIVFANGTIWTPTLLFQMLLDNAGTPQDDVIIGDNANNLISGRGGNDNLVGGAGSDTYIYNRGDGHDTIDETGGLWGSSDKLLLADINSNEASLTRNGNDVILVFTESSPGAGDAGSILIKNAIANWQDIGVEQIVFADGVTWVPAQLGEMLASLPSDGDDHLEGFGYSETMIGGKGNDELAGGRGNDVYIYARGDGHDVVNETGVSWGAADKLIFSDINSTDVSYIRNGADVTIVVNGSDLFAMDGGSVTIRSGLSTGNNVGVEQIQFADGVILTPADIPSKVLYLGAGIGNETITGTTGADSILAGAGDDKLLGLAGSDTYVYSSKDGSDYIDDESGSTIDIDVLRFTDLNVEDLTFSRSGAHAKITVNGTGQVITLDEQFYSATANWGIERVHFADGTIWNRNQIQEASWIRGTTGNDTLTGTAGDDVFSGGTGNDRFNSAAGSDTFVYARGDGADYIDEEYNSADIDTMRFTDLNASDLTFSRSGMHALITVNSTGDVITFEDQFWNPNERWGIDRILFADGMVWDRAQIIEASWVRGTSGNDVLGTSSSPFKISNAPIDMGLGDDVVYADYVSGNRIMYRSGDGNDVYRLWNSSASTNKIFLSDLSFSGIVLSKAGSDLLVSIQGTGETIVVTNQFVSGNYGIESLVFSDGSVLDRATISGIVSAIGGTAGNDTIVGTSAGETLYGGLGNDTLNGLSGDDTYIYARGDGNDVITETRGNGTGDKLVFTDINAGDVSLFYSGTDLTISIAESAPGAGNGGSVKLVGTLIDDFWQGFESITFADGTTWNASTIRQQAIQAVQTGGNDTMVGFNSTETYTGGHGNDVINGAGGDDTYVYARGHGNDIITETRGNGTADKLVFTDINAGDVSLSYVGTDLTISIAESAPGAGDGGSVKLVGTLIDDFWQGFESITFADGTTWNASTIRQQAIQAVQTGGNDTMVGFNSTETYTGGHGNDVINGAGGDDTYVYARGHGNDIITETRGNGTGDKLVFTDINAGDVSLFYSGTDLTISIAESAPGAGNGGSVKLVGTLIDDFWQGFESITFANGTTWNAATIRAQAIQAVQTSGNDTIVGFNSTETYTGGHGNDVINGAGGDDTYVYARGHGNDIITETRGNGTADKLVFTDINAGDVSLSYVGTDLTITIAESAPGAGDGGSVKLVGTLIDDFWQGFESIVFANGTTWNAATIRAQAIQAVQTSGNDTIVGFNSTETFIGGHGNDLINGIGGNDTYIYARGDGIDIITETRGNGSGDKLVFTDINAGNVSLSYSGTDLTITIAGSALGAGDGGSVKLVGTLIDDLGQGVDSIVFANGTTWNAATIRAQAIQAVQTSGNDTIVGFNSTETFIGGHGNDLINGIGGNDTYIYARGDGNDIITETRGNGTGDKLVFTDINAGDVTLTRNGADLTVWITGSAPGPGAGGSINLIGTLIDDLGQGVDSITFANGTIWNRSQMVANVAYVAGTAANETITGTTGGDIIMAGFGNDTLVGLAGNDTFVFEAGFGQDVVNDFVAGAGIGDVIRIKDGQFADFSSVMAASTQVGADTVITYDANNTIRLKNVSMTNLHLDDFMLG